MTSNFNLVRFCRLFAKHTAEHYRTYLMSIAVLAGVMILGGSFIFYVIPGPVDTGMQTAIFVILMLISGTIFTSTVFNDFGDKDKAIFSIMLPASSFEKYITGWLYSYPIFMVIYTCIFYLVLFCLSSIKQWHGEQFQALNLFQKDMIMLLFLYSFLHAIAIYGAIRFNKLQFIKIGFAFFIGYAVIMLSNTFFLNTLIDQQIKPALPFGYLSFINNGKYYSIAADNQTSGIITLILLLTAILIWIAAYYRLKEKQV